MNKYMHILLVVLILSCQANSRILKVGKTETLCGKKYIIHKNELEKNEWVTSKDFKREIRGIKNIVIRFNLPESCLLSNEIILWKSEIEKYLISTGFDISVLYEKQDDLLNENENLNYNIDAFFEIDKLIIKKIKDEINLRPFDDIDKNINYQFGYYISEMNAKIITKNNKVIWSCTSVSTSFELFRKHQEKIPSVFFSATRNSRFSDKLGRIIWDDWHLVISDNFSITFSGKINEDFHKRNLVSFAVKKLFEGIK